MTREEVARQIGWTTIIWTCGIVNIIAMLPQFLQVWITRNTEGLSLPFFVMIFMVQVAYSLQGYFRRDAMLMWTVGIAGGLSATTILSILYIRSFP